MFFWKELANKSFLWYQRRCHDNVTTITWISRNGRSYRREFEEWTKQLVMYWKKMGGRRRGWALDHFSELDKSLDEDRILWREVRFDGFDTKAFTRETTQFQDGKY